MHCNGNGVAVAAVVMMPVVLVVAKVQQANLDAGTAEPGECLNDLFLFTVHTTMMHVSSTPKVLYAPHMRGDGTTLVSLLSPSVSNREQMSRSCTAAGAPLANMISIIMICVLVCPARPTTTSHAV